MGRNTTTALFAIATAAALALTGCSSDSGGNASTSAASSTGRAAAPTTSGTASASDSSSASGTASGATTSGSGASGQDAEAAIRASLAAAKRAKLYHLVGEGTDEGKPLVFDIHFGTNGSDGSVTMSGAAIALKIVGSYVYFNAPASFYRAQGGGAAAKRLAGKWVRASKDSDTGKGFSGFADGQALITSFAGSFSDEDAEDIEAQGTGTVDGAATRKYGDDEGTIEIAASGTPYPLKLVSKGPGDTGTLTFSEWNKAYTVALPPASQIVPLPS